MNDKNLTLTKKPAGASRNGEQDKLLELYETKSGEDTYWLSGGIEDRSRIYFKFIFCQQ